MTGIVRCFIVIVGMLDGTNEISDNHQELEIKINELSLLASHGDLCNNR